MLCIVVFRHGETDWNLIGRLQGRENVALNEAGLRQAAEAAEALRGLHPAAIWSSPLDRALVTARTLADALGGGPVKTDEGLLERDFGVHSGKIYKNIFAAMQDEGMETLPDAADRLERTLRRIAREESRGPIFCVSHGAVLNALLTKVTNGVTGSGKLKIGNVHGCLFRLDGETLTAEAWNLSPAEIKERLCR